MKKKQPLTLWHTFLFASKCNDVIFKVKFPMRNKYSYNIMIICGHILWFFVALSHLLACNLYHAYTIFTHNSSDDGHKPFIFHKQWNQTTCSAQHSLVRHRTSNIFIHSNRVLRVYPSNCFIYLFSNFTNEIAFCVWSLLFTLIRFRCFLMLTICKCMFFPCIFHIALRSAQTTHERTNEKRLKMLEYIKVIYHSHIVMYLYCIQVHTEMSV